MRRFLPGDIIDVVPTTWVAPPVLSRMLQIHRGILDIPNVAIITARLMWWQKPRRCIAQEGCRTCNKRNRWIALRMSVYQAWLESCWVLCLIAFWREYLKKKKKRERNEKYNDTSDWGSLSLVNWQANEISESPNMSFAKLKILGYTKLPLEHFRVLQCIL